MYSALIIDDEALVREAVVALGNWSAYGIEAVHEASSAIEALALIAEKNPDIIITDMKMPVMDGVEFLKKLDERQCRSKILIISGFSDFQYTRQAIHSKVIDYILKPIDPHDLNTALEAAVSRIEAEKTGPETADTDPAPESIPNKTIYEIERYIRDNYHRNITLEELSRRFFVCKEHISRSFKKEFQVNLFEYLTRLRIDKSKELLAQTRCSIEEIAIQVGFSDGNYFGKAFKKNTEMTPSEYRQQMSPGAGKTT